MALVGGFFEHLIHVSSCLSSKRNDQETFNNFDERKPKTIKALIDRAFCHLCIKIRFSLSLKISRFPHDIFFYNYKSAWTKQKTPNQPTNQTKRKLKKPAQADPRNQRSQDLTSYRKQTSNLPQEGVHITKREPSFPSQSQIK